MDTVDAKSEMPTSQSVAVSAGDSAGIVFWCLIGLALAGMMPCMVLPAWREYQDATVTEQVRSLQMHDARRELDIMRKRLDAIHNDPVVISRLARRELGFQTPDEQVLHVGEMDTAFAAIGEAGVTDSPDLNAPLLTSKSLPIQRPVVVELPMPLARISAMLPALDYDRIFCHSPARELILVLSISLFVGAFVIFWPKPNSETAATDWR